MGRTEFVIVFIFGKASIIVITCRFLLVFGIIGPGHGGQRLDQGLCAKTHLSW
jgi:hypothetical protein